MPREPRTAVFSSKIQTGFALRFSLPRARARVRHRSPARLPAGSSDRSKVTMAHKFHSGELELQARAGVVELASRVGKGIHSSIPAAAGAFLEERRFVVLSAADAE